MFVMEFQNYAIHVSANVCMHVCNVAHVLIAGLKFLGCLARDAVPPLREVGSTALLAFQQLHIEFISTFPGPLSL